MGIGGVGAIGAAGAVGPGGSLLLALGIDEPVEPGDVVLGRLGAVLDERTGVDVQAVARGPYEIGGQAPGQLGPATLEEREAGRGREVAGESEAEPETAGVVGAGRLLALQQLLDQGRALVGDPVDLARPLGPEGGPGPPGPE